MPYKDPEAARLYHQKYHKKWYAKHKIERRQQIKRRRKDRKQWFFDFKKTLSCEICSFSNYPALDFHHSKDKQFHISNWYRYSGSKQVLLKELKDCYILCSNCHRDLHHGFKSQKDLPKKTNLVEKMQEFLKENPLPDPR